MTVRPRLTASIPFWSLVVVSIASAAAGAFLLADKLGVMTATLTDGTATGVEVYVGQSIAVVGAVLVGAGVIGILLALTVAAAASLRPRQVEIAEPADADQIDESEDSDLEFDEETGTGDLQEPVPAR